MASQGEKLKNIRQELGLSLEEAHKKTKIHLEVLKAIEEDRLVNLSPVYIKGFLKIYCKFLGVDPKDVLADYKEPQNIVKHPSDVREKPQPLLKKVSVRLVLLKSVPRKIKIVFIIILVIVVLSISLFNLGKIISSAKIKKRAKVTESEGIKTLSPISKPQISESKPQVQTKPVSGIKLSIRAKNDCWIQLKSDGKIVFQNILKKGRTETWQAKDKIELSLGNAGGVDLEVNGKLFSNLGRKGQALKNILITKEGIRVGQ